MTLEPTETLPEEMGIAIAHTPVALRSRMNVIFALDQRLGRIIAKSVEPALAQMRLAWWREMLQAPASERPSGDSVLDAIGKSWIGYEKALIALVDGWEELLIDPPLTKGVSMRFAQGRAAPFMCLVDEEARTLLIEIHAMRWALADLAAKVQSKEERAMLVSIGLNLEASEKRAPKELRGLIVLGALSLRALKRGGRPLMEGRGAGLTAFRAALLGR
ncbi:MAG: hypothetical protein ABJP48_01870 [Erythrobacter sp.]